MNLDFNRDCMSLEELYATREFRNLSAQCGCFVDVLIQSRGDQTLAAQQAFSCVSTEVARSMSYGLLRKNSIRAVLALFFQWTPREEFLEELAEVSRSRNVGHQRMRALELRARLLFGIDLKTLDAEAAESKAAKEPQVIPEFVRDGKYAVGQLVRFQGRICRITGINELGRATDYEVESSEAPSEVR